MARKKALITGITGQDGSYLAELLLAKGYEVHGLRRRSSAFNTQRINHIYLDPHHPGAKLFLHYGDLTDASQLSSLIHTIGPDEIYNLGAQSHVAVSFETPEYTGDVDALGTTRLLEGIRKSGLKTRFYQASSSEMLGAAKPPQNENTPFHPRSPYGVAKVYAYWKLGKRTQKEIGNLVQRTESAISHAIKRFEGRMQKDSSLREQFLMTEQEFSCFKL